MKLKDNKFVKLAHINVLSLALIVYLVNLAHKILKEKENIVIAKKDFSMLELLNANNVVNYVKLAITLIIVKHVLMDLIEKEKIAIVWMDSLMMELIFANNALNFV
jgi:hypothetical protein